MTAVVDRVTIPHSTMKIDAVRYIKRPLVFIHIASANATSQNVCTDCCRQGEPAG